MGLWFCLCHHHVSGYDFYISSALSECKGYSMWYILHFVWCLFDDENWSWYIAAGVVVGGGTPWLSHWGQVMHICIGKLATINSDNGLSPGRRQAIIWTNAGILSIGPLRTNFTEMLIEILTFSFKKICLKVSSVKCRPFCLGLNVL